MIRVRYSDPHILQNLINLDITLTHHYTPLSHTFHSVSIT